MTPTSSPQNYLDFNICTYYEIVDGSTTDIYVTGFTAGDTTSTYPLTDITVTFNVYATLQNGNSVYRFDQTVTIPAASYNSASPTIISIPGPVASYTILRTALTPSSYSTQIYRLGDLNYSGTNPCY